MVMGNNHPSKGTPMNTHPCRRAGLAKLGLLSLGDMSTILLTDGETPPYAVAAAALVLTARGRPMAVAA
jgi:hypothetical protein